ncbi:MFS polyamine transporter [Dendrothele bispora CBS 962.96]|uniref:MFS polyamine transporter n=1 Tax=Dendrothele bispora (strain CBS 962.96) TaxID=1314807 RepID=A0A4S8LJ80_DENBC|nr:MFS polyamine transporter [Dendrothele bispora CBS 962.96]
MFEIPSLHMTNVLEQSPSQDDRLASTDKELPVDHSRTSTLDGTVQIVDWDGPDDPQNPKNWSSKRKWASTLIVSCFTTVSPLASAITSPATKNIMQEFSLTNTTVEGMITSIFVLGFAVGPLFLGPLSEVYGRSRVIQWANIWFLFWNLVCGFSRNITQLIVFRFFAGVGGSAPLTIGAAVVGDTFHPEHRGRAIGIYALGSLVGPALGPVVGAWIAQLADWRWVFWSVCILDVLVQVVLSTFTFSKAYAPVLLKRKARRLMKTTETDLENNSKNTHIQFRTIYELEGENRSLKAVFSKALTRPFMLWVREPIIQLLGVYMALVYGFTYLLITTMPDIFHNVYHETTGIAGLNYIALGSGNVFASFLNSGTMDKIYQYYKTRNGGIGEPEFRVPTIVPGTILLPLGILMAGWGAQNHAHWIVVDIGIFCVGMGQILAFQCIQTYIVDVFPLYAASALAVLAFTRSLCGFSFPLFANSLYESFGYGKGNTIVSAIAIALGCPAPWILWFYGKKIRDASRHAKKS